MPETNPIPAAVAGPPFPLPSSSPPAMVLMFPFATLRTRELPNSPMYRTPAFTSNASPTGFDSSALVAGPPSPDLPATPVPATALMMVVPASTTRTRFAGLSEIYRFPAPSNASACGLLNIASVAGPPSPKSPILALPAYTLMIRVGELMLTTRTRCPSCGGYEWTRAGRGERARRECACWQAYLSS